MPDDLKFVFITNGVCGMDVSALVLLLNDMKCWDNQHLLKLYFPLLQKFVQVYLILKLLLCYVIRFGSFHDISGQLLDG